MIVPLGYVPLRVPSRPIAAGRLVPVRCLVGPSGMKDAVCGSLGSGFHDRRRKASGPSLNCWRRKSTATRTFADADERTSSPDSMLFATSHSDAMMMPCPSSATRARCRFSSTSLARSPLRPLSRLFVSAPLHCGQVFICGSHKHWPTARPINLTAVQVARRADTDAWCRLWLTVVNMAPGL